MLIVYVYVVVVYTRFSCSTALLYIHPRPHALAGVAFDVWGNVDFADQYANRVRAVVMSTSVDCPAGYTCACAAPVPCTATSAATSSSASYCPANSVTPVAVTPGYVALANSAGLLVSQGACPIGTYCLGGILTQCPPGTYGTAPRQVLPSACVPCPAGTFSVAMGATGSSSCSPCPARTNTTTAISGGAPGAALSRGAGFCPWWPANVASVVNGVAVPCAEGTFAFPGPFGGCLSVPNPESIGVTDGTAVSAQFPPTDFVTRDASSVPLQVTAAVPIGEFVNISTYTAMRICINIYTFTRDIDRDNVIIREYVYTLVQVIHVSISEFMRSVS